MKRLNSKLPWKLISKGISGRIATTIPHLYYTLFPHPKVLQLHINRECNLNCTYCYNKKETVLSTGKWMSLIDEFKKLGGSVIEILGGEPFLHKKLHKLLSYAGRKKFSITLYTNGILIEEADIEKLRRLNDIIISVKYGYGAEIYEEDKELSKQSKIEETIKKLVQAKIPVVTFITVTKFNVNKIKEIIKKSLELGTFPVIERYIPVKDKSTNEKFDISAKEWDFSLKIIKYVYKDFESLIKCISLIRGRTCSCFGDQLSISQGGKVLPCPFAPNSMILGNVNVDSLKKISKVNRKKLKEWMKIPTDCKKCKNKSICRGGCKTMTILKKDNLNNKDPQCLKDIPTTLGHCAFTIIHNIKSASNTRLRRL